MLQKLYPRDQIDQYLLIDVIALLSLAYQVFIVHKPFGLIGSLLLYSIYLSVFYVSLWHQDERLLVSVYIGCGVLAVLGMVSHLSLTVFAFMQAGQLGLARSKRLIGLGMPAFPAMHAAAYYGHKGDLSGFVPSYSMLFLLLQLVIPVVVYFVERSRSLGYALDEANKKIERYVQEEERNRIARDLHDTLGQTLTMIKMKSELAIRLMDKQSDQAKQEMQEVRDTSRTALKQVRELVTSMKQVSLEEEIQHAHTLFRMAGVHLVLRETGPRPDLSHAKETMLALSIREAFTNVIKHSQAKRCTVQMGWNDGRYEVRVMDDGIGSVKEEKRGHGLESIRERMCLADGDVGLESPAGGGFVVTLRIPAQSGERVKVP
ncbi:sensor histidine kinase [Desmospora profundinema]|uniref:histidine kinase n=1 Tax=Desmospora profundinema TaxID=1571184 RepID=A0ABU1IJT5_9BACL|nr:sensor histidine kinase [Desmospora profundinema]MDR6224946.1 two-component system sensor histidine kinase DesK [Desmospora profundinema]